MLWFVVDPVPVDVEKPPQTSSSEKTGAVTETTTGRTTPAAETKQETGISEKTADGAVVSRKSAENEAVADDVVADEEEDDAANHVHGIPLILLAFGLCVTTFLIGLDQMIIATVSSVLFSSDGCQLG